MFPMRLKIGQSRTDGWHCCFCLHVRTATIILGVWQLILHVISLVVLAMLMRNNNSRMQRDEIFQQNDFLPTPLSKIKEEGNPYYLPTTQDGSTIYSSDIDMGALMTVCTLSMTLLMVYGAIKIKATYLLPFFCLQLFDFAITTLTATGYFCYLRSAHRLVAEHWHNLPFRNELLQLSPQYLSLIVLATFLVTMIWKAYWIGVVWRCYKYLALRQIMRNTGQYIPEPDLDSTLLRDREVVFNSAMKQTPPPSYQDIMNDQPPPYPVTVLADSSTYQLPVYQPQGEISQENASSVNANTHVVDQINIQPEAVPGTSAADAHNDSNTASGDSVGLEEKTVSEVAVVPKN